MPAVDEIIAFLRSDRRNSGSVAFALAVVCFAYAAWALMRREARRSASKFT